jgi:polar amino acid transport system substrate-binding protein
VKRWTHPWAIWLVISLFAAACGASLPGPRTKVLVGTTPSFPPFETVDQGRRNIIGFDIDLMKAVAARSNLEVEFTSVGYESLLAGIADCTYEVGISAITIDDALQSRMQFSNPYFVVGQVVVVKQGNPTITRLEALAGQTVGVQAGTAGAAEVAKIPGAQAQVYPVIDQAFNELINGLLDAVVADNTVALSYTSVPATNLKIVGEPFAASNYGIAVCNRRTDLLKRINLGLAAVRADGTLDRLTRQWIISGGR